MRRQSDGLGPEGFWDTYEPGRDGEWNSRRVVHLHRRAAFSATWSEIQRDLHNGPEKAIGRLLRGEARAETVPAEFEQFASHLADWALATTEPVRLKGWWVYRMLLGPDPLGERLTLMWHDHFATSNLKLSDLVAMRRQNETLRSLCRAPFGHLLRAMMLDPALLTWLDAADNTSERPNENLARELMELFTLGVGHYTERDVKEVARALTGWRLVDGEPSFVASRHDAGPHTILGRTESFGTTELATLLLGQHATAQRLAWRLCREFMGEGQATAAAIEALAEGLRDHDLDIGWATQTILRSRAFFAEPNLRSRTASPVEFVVGVARALELFDPPASTTVLAEWCGRLGQDLFYPPNVGGWPGGRTWITTRSAIGRTNFAAALLEGTAVGLPAPVDLVGLAKRHDCGNAPEFFARLMLGTAEPAIHFDDATTVRHAVGQLVASPSGQRA